MKRILLLAITLIGSVTFAFVIGHEALNQGYDVPSSDAGIDSSNDWLFFIMGS